MISCISHDLDHRGTNNSFQQKMNNPLAKLYTTSTLERHHLNQCLLLLALRGNNILDNLSKVSNSIDVDIVAYLFFMFMYINRMSMPTPWTSLNIAS